MKYFKKITDTYDPKDKKWFVLNIKNFDVEREDSDSDLSKTYNIITIWFNGRYRRWLIPFSIVKPAYDYTTKSGHKIFAQREYGITKNEFSISLDIGSVEQMLYNRSNLSTGKQFTFVFPCVYLDKVQHHLLDIDGEVFNSDIKCYIEDVKKQPYMIFGAKDFDGEDVVIQARRMYSKYTYGKGKFWKWIMKHFKDPVEYYVLELEFITNSGNGIGKNKDSWKGGIIFDSIDIDKNVPTEHYVAYYCVENKLKIDNNY